MIPPDTVPKSQLWFWSPEWQAKEQEADDDIAAGRLKAFDSAEELLEDLRSGFSATEDGQPAAGLIENPKSKI